MTLASAMHTAQAIFRNTGEQTSVISKNIANSGNADYVRRSAVIMTSSVGADVVTTERSQNTALQKQMFLATSANDAQDALLSGLERLQSVLGGNEYELSPSTYLAKLRDNLQAFAGNPGERSLAETTVSTAQDLVNSISTVATEIQNVRTEADREIGEQVDQLNYLLSQYQVVNDKVITETATKGDPNDALDQRDALLRQISSIIGVTTIRRDNNDLSLYTTDGTTLFETVPRAVTFTPTVTYAATTTGNGIYIDGVEVNAGVGGDTDAMGTLPALVQLRDEVAPTFQKQLDEIARGLVEAFAETPPGGATALNPAMPGLFTWLGGTVPTTGTVVTGFASTLKVNTAYVSTAGGDPMKLRDGGVNGAAYNWNTSNGAGYSDLIDHLGQELEESRSFDPSTTLSSSTSLFNFASDSIGWLEGLRSGATTGYENKAAMLSRATEAYTNITGVSLDEELSLLLDVEQSYKASTKLVSAVDEMLQALLQMAG